MRDEELYQIKISQNNQRRIFITEHECRGLREDVPDIVNIIICENII